MPDKSALFSAVDTSNFPSVSSLLQDLSSSLDLSSLRTFINQRDPQNRTVLHLSASNLNPDITQILLEAGCDPNSQDVDGQTPTFLLFSKLTDCSCDSCTKSCLRCLAILAYHGASLDIPNNAGTTPLSLCASNRFQECCRALLEHGACLGTSNGQAMVEILVEKVPAVVETIFDRSITLSPSRQTIYDTDFELTFDLSTILPPEVTSKTGSTANLQVFPTPQWFNESYQPSEEMAFLKELLKFSESDATAYKSLLRHPLVNVFTDVKWKSLESLYLLSLVLQSTVLLLYTGFILATIFVDCPYDIFLKIGQGIDKISGIDTSEIINPVELCEINVISKMISILVLVCTLVILVKEVQHACYDLKEYLKDLTNYFQLVGFLSVTYTVVVAWDVTSPLYTLLYPAAAFGITISWCQLFVQIGRLPKLAIYVEMFVKISINFCTSLAIYSCLLIGFAMSFSILFPEKPRLANLPLSFIKIMTMLVGEMDYDNLFASSSENSINTSLRLENDTSFTAQIISLGNQHRFAGRIWYLTFLVFITLVLMNLLVGLAVSDIQGIRKNAEIYVIKRRIRYIAYLERSLFEATVWLPHKLQRILRENVAIKRSKEKKLSKFICCFDYLCSPIKIKSCKLTIRPNDPQNNRLLSNESKISIRHWLLSKSFSKLGGNCTASRRTNSVTSTTGFRQKNRSNFRKSSSTSFVIPQQMFVKAEPAKNVSDTERLKRLELNAHQLDKKLNEVDVKLEIILKTLLRPDSPK